MTAQDLQPIKFRGTTHQYYVTKMRPRFSEVDSYHVVWNGHYVNYFEQARSEFCRAFGITLDKLSELGFYLPVYKYEVTMRKPIFLEDEMEVAVRPVFTNETLFEFHHLILVNGEVRVTGIIQQVAMEKTTGEISFKLPEPVLNFLKPLYGAIYGKL